ncbi:hypothetical protein BGZ49_007181 [Haplosporangium sp. Z 27]|nr:hypothetical protein BGZ49_007181 [Haplosporangium sp. Z 27]
MTMERVSPSTTSHRTNHLHMELDPSPLSSNSLFTGPPSIISAAATQTTNSIPQVTEPRLNFAIITESPNVTNAASWFYKPHLQPSTITTTATSSLMPSSMLTRTKQCCAVGTASESNPTPISLLPARARTPATLYATLQSALASGTIVGATQRSRHNSHNGSTPHPSRTIGPYSSQLPDSSGTIHVNPLLQPPIKDESVHHNPYRSPSQTNSRAFVPPKVPGYEFVGGSQAGNMGLMIGKRLSDGVPVTGKMHQSKTILQHEYRILKRLSAVNSKYIPGGPIPSQFNPDDNEKQEDIEQVETTSSPESIKCKDKGTHDGCQPRPGSKRAIYEPGCVETEKFFLRVVEDFIELEQEDMSILILERLGHNLLFHTHCTYTGLEGVEGLNNTETQKLDLGSPFPDVYTFLIFALKAASILEALTISNLAHLAISPSTLHWAPPPKTKPKFKPNNSEIESITDKDNNSSSNTAESPSSSPSPSPPPQGPDFLYSLLKEIDVNDTRLRLLDFSHSKILSHERARAPNNIAEWQIPGFLEYHLQFLAPEQTGRAETWMDNRTDIYGLGATLFTLLTMHFPYTGSDSVQILQGVLSRDLPLVRDFRPDMPPIIDDILQKMTRKQPSQRYQNAFGLKQDILRCLNLLDETGQIESFELGKHDISYQFVLPNSIFGRQTEHQMITAAIEQAATAYQNSLNSQMLDGEDDEARETPKKPPTAKDADHYVFEDNIVSLKSQVSSKIPLSSKTLLRTLKPFSGVQSVHRGPETTDPIVRVVFVSGSSGVGKTFLIRGMAAVARGSGLFAGGSFEQENSAPYSAILSCIQSVLQQLLAQHTDALASLVVAIRTAFEPNSGIGIICDLVPELRYFFSGSEMIESKDVPLAHSITRFHALILKLIRVISTHFFMTWLIDDLDYADENSIDLLATLVNVNKRLPIVLIITHRDTLDCLMKVQHILGGGNTIGGSHSSGLGALGAVHHDKLMGDLSAKGGMSSRPMSKSSALRGTGDSLVVRGGGGVRFIRLQNPTMDTIQDFLAALLHRDKADVVSLAKVLNHKSWLTIRQLVLQLYKNQTIYFNCGILEWEWESNQETLAETVRKLTGEEYAFLETRFRTFDCNTKRALVCAAVCGPSFMIQDLERLITETYSWMARKPKPDEDVKMDTDAESEADTTSVSPVTVTEEEGEEEEDCPNSSTDNGCNAMAGIQVAIREGILVYTSVTDHLRFHHGIMRKVALAMLKDPEDMERLHFDMITILFSHAGQEFRIAGHVIQCLNLIKKKLAMGARSSDALHDTILKSNNLNPDDYWKWTEGGAREAFDIDTRALRRNLSLAGEKSQKSGAQDMALTYWNAALALLPENCWDQPPEKIVDSDICMHGQRSFPQSPTVVNNDMLLYHEALKLHLQCIEAERWRENFDQAMKICKIVLSKVEDPIDRARVYQHQIEMYVWAYSSPEQAMETTIQCLHELGMSKDVVFFPTDDEIKEMFHQTHALLLEHMPVLEANPPRLCTNPKISMMMEVLQVASLACTISNGNHHVRFLFYLAVQHWGEHVAASIPALEETLTAVDLTCDRLFHTAGMIHVSVMKVLVGRVYLNDLMTTTIELLTKHIEFGPKSHGVEVMQGILQMIKCLMGRTLSSDPKTIFEDIDFSEIKGPSKNHHSMSNKKSLTLVHNNSTYQMLKVLAAFIFGHYAFIQEVTDVWHDDPKSIMNFEGSWITHAVYTVVGLALANLLRTETDPEVRKKHKRRLFRIREQMELHAKKYPTNHAAMYYLVEAEIADQGLTPGDDDENNDSDMTETKTPKTPMTDKIQVLLLYEKAIKYSVDGDFPLHKCFAYELAAKSHMRHGLVTNGRHLMVNACKVYQKWGAKGKVQWFHNTYPDFFPTPLDVDTTSVKRGLFYGPSDNNKYSTSRPLATSAGKPNNPAGAGSSGGGAGGSVNSSPWVSGSPKPLFSPSTFPDTVSATAAAMAGTNMASFHSGCPSATSTSSTLSAPLYSLQNTWLSSPQTPEMDDVDLDALDFSQVIEAMQVVASEIDLDLLLVKSLGVLNQSVSAKRCCIIISKDNELVLSASLGDSGRCESVNPPTEISKCNSLFHGVINYVVNTSTSCLLTNAKDDPRFCADEYLNKQRVDLKTVLCAPIIHKAALVGVLYMEDFPERAFANKRMLVMNVLVQQLGISITNALLYQSVLQSETKLNGLLENMPCGIALWDANAEKCQYINSTWADMTGYSAQEIMDSAWSILVHPEELVAYGLAWKQRVREGLPNQWECRYGLKDGTYRWAVVRMLPILSATDNKILQWLTVSIDIDDQRRAVQLKSNFLANMSHELRTPFSGILGMLSLLRDSSGLTHEQFEFVDMAKASCEMLIRIVDDLLNFSKLEADKVTLEYIPLCFEEILGDVCDLLVPLASRKGLELIILPDIKMPVLLIGDPDRMKQILMNLIGNAIKFSTSGNVVIKYWHEIRKRDTITRESKQSVVDFLSTKGNFEKIRTKIRMDIEDESKYGDEVILYCSVTDEGIGMTPEEQKMLFVSFQQTDSGTTRKYGGTGLGLSICAQLISHMNGKVVVESEKDKGSTFTFFAKLRTMSDYDGEQNPSETARIKDCGTVIDIRSEAVSSKRFLILSPNKSLRDQIAITINGAEYMEFDGVEAAVQCGAIGILGASQSCHCNCSDTIREPATVIEAEMEEIDGIINASTQPSTESVQCSCGLGAKPQLDGSIRQFDFILVDHVLDSAELDCIYPSPSVAFVLLLAPTTETLRWILPPARKSKDLMDEELDSIQVDVGGRGRIQKVSEVEFAEKAFGQVASTSYLSKITAQSPSALRPKRPIGPPSELFKRKKGHSASKKRRTGEAIEKSGEFTAQRSSSETPGAEGRSNSPCSSFQVCRMIKPVRRLKLLQILYNALMEHDQRLSGESNDDDDADRSNCSPVELSDESNSDEDMEDAKDSRMTSTTADNTTIPCLESPTKISLKRRFCKQSSSRILRGQTDEDEEQSSSSSSSSIRDDNLLKSGRHVHKAVKLSGSPLQPSPSLSRKMKKISRISSDGSDFPKRARNNDALTLLLTHEERERCMGINVLVAEDDFVSQKILEKQLSKLGMNVVIANNGQEAVEKWLSVERGHYTIAIFDHHMPIMDGLAATKKIRAIEGEENDSLETNDENNTKNYIRIPIVGLSADIQLATKEKCIEAGMDEYMTKPLLTQGLALLIQRYCCN